MYLFIQLGIVHRTRELYWAGVLDIELTYTYMQEEQTCEQTNKQTNKHDIKLIKIHGYFFNANSYILFYSVNVRNVSS